MSSYLSQFNYQFVRSQGQSFVAGDEGRADLRRFVFLHGLMGYGLNWRRVATSLGERDLALIYDQRGHGRSLKPASGYSPDDYAEDLELIRQELGWESFHLIGHSMGGRNALVYASRFSERVEKLVIEDMGPDAKPEAHRYYQSLLESVPVPFVDKKQAKEWFLNEFPRLAWTSSQSQTLGSYLYSNLIEDEKGRAVWRFSKPAMIESVVLGRGKDHWNEWKSLEMPVLVLRGAESKDLSREVFEQMLTTNSRAKGVEVSNAGHWIHTDQPQAFIDELRSFVDS